MWTTPDGTRLEPLNGAEKDWVDDELANVVAFVERYAQVETESLPSLADIDIAWANFTAQVEPTDGNSLNAAINAVGMAFGQALVDSLALQWVAASDASGCELAVVGLPGEANFLVYPTNFVSKRWQRREVDFLVESQRLISEKYAQLRSETKAS